MTHSPILRPLGSRVLVKPDAPVEETASGFLIPEAFRNQPAMSGIVQALGTGPERDRRIRVATIDRCVGIVEELAEQFPTCGEYVTAVQTELGRYLNQVCDIEHVCAVGERVVFPMEAGHEIVLNEDTNDAVIVLREDDVIGVCDPATEVAA